MEKFNFVYLFLQQLFENNGLYEIYVFIIGSLGLLILYKIILGWIKTK